jgi:hypothetical protein
VEEYEIFLYLINQANFSFIHNLIRNHSRLHWIFLLESFKKSKSLNNKNDLPIAMIYDNVIRGTKRDQIEIKNVYASCVYKKV